MEESRCKLQKWEKKGENDERQGLGKPPAALTRGQTGIKLATPTQRSTSVEREGSGFIFPGVRSRSEVSWLQGSSRCQDTEFTPARRR